MLSFKPTFSCSSFTLIKRLFSSSLLSAIRVVSSAYLRLLIFLNISIDLDWLMAAILDHVALDYLVGWSCLGVYSAMRLLISKIIKVGTVFGTR